MKAVRSWKRVVSPPGFALWALALTAIFSLTSCDRNRVFEKNEEIKDYVWDVKDIKKFDVTITDTLTPHNFYINVRNADGYQYSNLYLFVKTIFPNGKFARDTLECVLANEEGRWLGKGLGDIWDNQILFKRGKRFPLKGNYSFLIEQGMRQPKLPMIMDVGMRI
ncbi:MAG TPA: gliding motility lipoprotein GldH, partial [Bacteroidia bacterium]|nr:gliding motility lipoprotein GldH [Bacteroidia bacterium]